MTQHVHGKRWIAEFSAEIHADARALADCRTQRAGTSWSYDTALARTRAFYVERISGFATCGSVSEAEKQELLRLVEGMG